ncbi:MAG: beta-ketoacyl-ACP synthase II [Coriobacteriales bacterium]|jgi:3-oxoacyl-[acyl-carrier-protein] synthase II|nr:beta-ketoacyl-ACP synthase II [Coriobacteriales bacterium]
MQRKVVVTGLGAVTPIGNTAKDFWSGIKSGKLGIAPLSYDRGDQKASLAAECDIDFTELIPKADLRKMDRFTQLAVVAANEACADANLDAEPGAGGVDKDRVDTIVASGIGGMSTTTREYERGCKRGFDKISPFYIPMTISNMAAGRIAIYHGFHGDCSCLVTACASSTHAIGEAMRHIRHGYADVAVAGGAEAAVIPLAMGGFTSMQALHIGDDPTRASIPFDAERSGFILGEGAGMVVLEEEEHAKARGARIYAELAGFGASCDAYHITAPDPEARGAVEAMRRAIADAELAPDDISYINAHGTSTPLNDKCETLAIHEVFGQDAPPTSSTKSMTGHLLGAAGAIETIASVLACYDSYMPATINYKVPDPECDLDVIPNEGRNVPVDAAMSNSLGFGGHNATLVVKRYE